MCLGEAADIAGIENEPVKQRFDPGAEVYQKGSNRQV
jgi:hypothetical protein